MHEQFMWRHFALFVNSPLPPSNDTSLMICI